jgi:NADPH:quinone reductase-like Zn-dependent oxidoreductase
VTAVCGTDSVELVRGQGADRVIDYTAEDITKDAQAYHVVLDAVGKSSFGRCRRLPRCRTRSRRGFAVTGRRAVDRSSGG